MLIYLIAELLIAASALAKDSRHDKSLYYSKYGHDVYYDNKLIPDDTEIDVVLHKGQIQKMFYVLNGNYKPISVTVTPCSSESYLQWKLVHASTVYHSDPWSNHVVRPSTISPAGTYLGKERRAYSNPRAPPGLYTLELRSERDSRAKVLVTARATNVMPYYPPLPPEHGVQIVKIKRNRILISWKASPSARHLEYCVTSNNRGNYNSLCAVDSLAKMACIGRKTWHAFKGLQGGKTYYFDVFVKDMETNASSAYVGVSATVRGSVPRPSRIEDDMAVIYYLDSRNGYALTAKYHAGKSTGSLLLFVQSCTGPGPVTFTLTQQGTAKRELLSTSVTDIKTLKLPHQMATPTNSSGTYLLSFRSTVRHPRKIRAWLSSRRHSFPFPALPRDKSVSVFDTLTTCDSITIGWKASPDERVKYCIYRRATSDSMQQLLSEPQNFCEPPIDGSAERQTVLCRRYHRFSKRRFNNVIMQRVRGLQPGSTYLFEVQVTKVKGKMLPYERVWATTHDKCKR